MTTHINATVRPSRAESTAEDVAQETDGSSRARVRTCMSGVAYMDAFKTNPTVSQKKMARGGAEADAAAHGTPLVADSALHSLSVRLFVWASVLSTCAPVCVLCLPACL